MLSVQQFPALTEEEERYRQVLSANRVLGTDEDNMGDGCSQKLASAKFLRLLLLILIPCICALILLLVILLTFVGVLEKACFYSNGSEVLTVNGDIETSDVLLPNMVENSSKTDPTMDLSTQPSSWTTTPSSHIDQMNKNSSIFRNTFQQESFALTTQASPHPTYDAALAEESEDDTQIFSTAEEVTLWSTHASFSNTDRIATLPVLSPTHPSVSQNMDQRKTVSIVTPLPLHRRLFSGELWQCSDPNMKSNMTKLDLLPYLSVLGITLHPSRLRHREELREHGPSRSTAPEAPAGLLDARNGSCGLWVLPLSHIGFSAACPAAPPPPPGGAAAAAGDPASRSGPGAGPRALPKRERGHRHRLV